MHTTLVSVDELAAALNALDAASCWVVIDCRHDLAHPEAGEAAWRAGSVPGARFAHTDRDLSGMQTGANGRHPLPTREGFAAFLANAGVADATQIVAYDASDGIYAARLWWLAKWIGHDAVAVLDGGLPAWQRAGLPVDAHSPALCNADKTRLALAIGPSRVAAAEASEVEANLASRERLVVDARSPERYRGDVEPLDAVGGHIPHAVNRHYKNNFDAGGRFKPASQLRAEFDALFDGRAAGSIVHQCGSGVTACHNLLAMEIAGLPGAALYAGSWSEWCSDPKRPVARGA